MNAERTVAAITGGCGGLVAGGFQRMPNGEWAIGPLVTGNVFSV
jgi:hypothetical protein